MTDHPHDLDEFLERYDRDDNEWWRLDNGDQLNLFDALLEDRDGWRDIVTSTRSQQRAALRRADRAGMVLRRVAKILDDAERYSIVSKQVVVDRLRALLAASDPTRGQGRCL